MSRLSTAALFGAAALLFSPSLAHASGVLPPATEGAPTTLDIQMAVGGGTRWTRIRTSGPSRVMWLVPARPGAAIDWAPDAWLDALDDATTPRVVAPDATPPCGMSSAVDRISSYATVGWPTTPTEVLVHTTESSVRAHAAALGYAVSSTMATRIAQVFASGSSLVSIELATPATTTTPTLRVSDGGPALLPLALTGTQGATTHVTAFLLGDGPTVVDGTVDVDPTTLTWGPLRSTYADQRDALVAGGAWVRESSTHRALFDGYAVPRSTPVRAALETYLRAASPNGATCAIVATSLSSETGTLGRVCAPGSLAVVPGTTCTPTTADVDPGALTCGDAIDAALALSGIAPRRATVTRLAGSIPRSGFGADLAVASGGWELTPVLTAASYQVCAVAPPSPTPVADPPPPDPPPTGEAYVTTTESCSGDTTTSTTEEPDGTQSETTTSQGCSGDTTTTSTQSDSSSSDNSSGCGGDTSSSQQKSDSSSSSQDEGWDKSDSSSSSSNDSCGSSSSDAGAKTTRRAKSKVSRYAMLFVFLVLPVRRRLRTLR